MGLEAGTYISDLVSTNPLATDLESQGDDHLRLIKTLLKQTFLDTFTAGIYLPKSTSAANALILATMKNLGAGMSMVNGVLVPSVAASALTIALKTLAGTDPSATDPVYVIFKNVTAGNASYSIITITAATSFVVSSGSTLGAVNSVAFKLHVLGFNDGGTFRLGVVNKPSAVSLDETLLLSSTAEGGAGAADSADVVYTGTAVASKSFRVLGTLTWSSGLATAGTWNAAPTVAATMGDEIQQPVNKVVLQVFTGNGTYTPTLGTKYALLGAIGGGAGAGGCANSTAGNAGSTGGGGGGSTSLAVKTAAQIGASQTVTVGAAANGGAAGNNNGTAGNDSSIGALVVGKGGSASTGAPANSGSLGGAGGVAGTGDITIIGGKGHRGNQASALTLFCLGGAGGMSGLGFGSGGREVIAASGENGSNYGGGGSGGSSSNAAGAVGGGNGAQGFCFALDFVSI